MGCRTNPAPPVPAGRGVAGGTKNGRPFAVWLLHPAAMNFEALPFLGVNPSEFVRQTGKEEFTMEKGKKMRAVSAAVGIKDFPSVFLGLPGNLRRSALELKEVRSLCGIALMLALSVAVDQFSFYVGPVKVGLGSLVSAMLGCFYGPVAGGLAAGAGDIVKYLVRPTGAFFFGYTLNAILGAALYGVFFYKMRVSVLRAAVCKLVINVCVNGLLGTLWYAMLYGKGFNAIFWPRMITNIGKVPVETVVLLLLLPALIAAAKRAKLRI